MAECLPRCHPKRFPDSALITLENWGTLPASQFRMLWMSKGDHLKTVMIEKHSAGFKTDQHTWQQDNRCLLPEGIEGFESRAKIICTSSCYRKTRPIRLKIHQENERVATQQKQDRAERASSPNTTKNLKQNWSITNARRVGSYRNVKTLTNFQKRLGNIQNI